MKQYFSSTTKKLQHGGSKFVGTIGGSKLVSLLSSTHNRTIPTGENGEGHGNNHSTPADAAAAAATLDSLDAGIRGAPDNTNNNTTAHSRQSLRSVVSKVASTVGGSVRTTIHKQQPQISMDWDKIYVEIDNDANATSIGPVPTSDSASTLGETFINTTTYDDTEESYTIMEDTTCASHSYVRNHLQSSHSRDDDTQPGASVVQRDDTSCGAADAEDDGTRRVRPTTTTTTHHHHQYPRYHYEEEERDRIAEDYSITKDGKYLSNNHFANAQLLRWKHAAEEGPACLQILAFVAAGGALTSTVYPFVMWTIEGDDDVWSSLTTLICAVHTLLLCLLIVIFEVRACRGARNPMSVRARLRTVMVRYFNILRLIWGRGLLYITTGSLNIAVGYTPWVYYTGGTLLGLGLLAILIGAHASFNLERLRLSLTDDAFLWSKYDEADADKDQLLGISEFSQLIWSLGLELDDAYTYRAFQEIDHNADAKITFHEFKAWWIAAAATAATTNTTGVPDDGDETILTVEEYPTTRSQHHRSSSSRRTIPGHINV